MTIGREIGFAGAVRWRTEVVEAPGAVLPARIYTPARPALGCVVWAHGGSWRAGSIEDWHGACALLCAASSWTVVSVEYRLAPRHPHPAPVHDLLHALDWAARRTAGDGGPLPLAVGGDSAGGTIAACAALARRDLGRPLDLQVLAYPPLDPECAAPSYGIGGFPDPRALRASWQAHRARGGSVEMGGVILHSTPFEAAALDRLPPAILAVGTLDPVADDVRAYARALREADNEVELHELPGVSHGAFITTEALAARLGTALLERSS